MVKTPTRKLADMRMDNDDPREKTASLREVHDYWDSHPLFSLESGEEQGSREFFEQHSRLREEVERYADPPFLHQMHVTDHKIECTNCHMQIEHSLAAGASWGRGSPDLAHTTGKSGTCAQCHQKMHAGPAELYRGTGGRGVIDMPSPMFRAQVDCIACHRNDTTAAVGPAEMSAHTFVASQVSCDYCHDTQYQSSLDEWRGLVTENLSRADAAYAAAQEMAVDAVLSGEEHQRVRELLEDAEHNIRLVKMGHGVHNVNYATAVLSVAVERCQEAQDLMTKKAIAAEAGP